MRWRGDARSGWRSHSPKFGSVWIQKSGRGAAARFIVMSDPRSRSEWAVIGERGDLAAAKRFAEEGGAYHNNPNLLVLANPKGGKLFGKEVIEIRYVHAEDGRAYKHDFGSDVRMAAMPDGSVRLYSTTGRRIWGDFI